MSFNLQYLLYPISEQTLFLDSDEKLGKQLTVVCEDTNIT